MRVYESMDFLIRNPEFRIRHRSSPLLHIKPKSIKFAVPDRAADFFWRPYRRGNTCSHSEHSR